jgi:hypothetical protein
VTSSCDHSNSNADVKATAPLEREKMSFNSLLTVLSSYWWSSNNPAAKPIKTQQKRTTRRSMRSPSTGADFNKRQSESYQQPMYNDKQRQEVVQQNDGHFFSQQQELLERQDVRPLVFARHRVKTKKNQGVTVFLDEN